MLSRRHLQALALPFERLPKTAPEPFRAIHSRGRWGSQLVVLSPKGQRPAWTALIVAFVERGKLALRSTMGWSEDDARTACRLARELLGEVGQGDITVAEGPFGIGAVRALSDGELVRLARPAPTDGLHRAPDDADARVADSLDQSEGSTRP